ncbi:hypothetical protein AOL_s00117g65 [Orbilia oligospora ATCC 24927]|uniref:Uncharacterized protein n=1 Tax=Arthrobotrys oligospora (strain ATCC 24927 / CBS 115.81 / DSM 1491) TaxID=756982 RepID=G1XM18_ARTOA|nr:hypothetical protein AOL_s00117g65 [Orbilia oligospora ATCC 24927]EGX45860.1 hypothetical protein AOL_s00117g65 [Orbilia oligospora ATCC 24927]
MPSLSQHTKSSLDGAPGMAPCRNCGDTLEILQGKMASYTLPIGVRPNSLHKDFYDNLVKGPHVIDTKHDYLCLCGDPEAHIHCLQCLTEILKEQTAKEMDFPEVLYPDPRSLAEDSMATLLSFVESAEPPPPQCSHRLASRTSRSGNPEVFPRSIADVHIDDITQGRDMGMIFHQQIGSTMLCRNSETPMTIAEQPNHVQYWMRKNYGSAAKGYKWPPGDKPIQIVTPQTAFLERFSEDIMCHSTCVDNGSKDLLQYSYCRMIESGIIVWLMDLGVLDSPCCGNCDMDSLVLALSFSVDTNDRIRDELTGELFNVHKASSRQVTNQLGLEAWKWYVIHGADGFCCERARRFFRANRNMFIWGICGPGYYTHVWGQKEGVMQFAVALHHFLMKSIRRSQDGCKDVGREGPALVDEMVKRANASRLVDFLVYFCA